MRLIEESSLTLKAFGHKVGSHPAYISQMKVSGRVGVVSARRIERAFGLAKNELDINHESLELDAIEEQLIRAMRDDPLKREVILATFKALNQFDQSLAEIRRQRLLSADSRRLLQHVIENDENVKRQQKQGRQKKP